MATLSPVLRVPLTTCRILRSNTTKYLSWQQPPYSAVQRPHLRLPSSALSNTYHNYRNNKNNNNRDATVPSCRRAVHTSQSTTDRQRKPLAHNGEEVPDQPPPTDFGRMDLLGSTPVPSTAVTACHEDGFSLDSGIHITGGDGALLVGGEAFAWRPWSSSSSSTSTGATSTQQGKGRRRRLVNDKGQWEVREEGFALLGVVWPRPGTFFLFFSFLFPLLRHWAHLNLRGREG
jgi:hypothetical protein